MRTLICAVLMVTGLNAFAAETAYVEMLNAYLGKPKQKLLQFAGQLKVYEVQASPPMFIWQTARTFTVPGQAATSVTTTRGSVDETGGTYNEKSVTTHHPGYATQVYQRSDYVFFYYRENGDIYKWESWAERDFDGKAWKPILGMNDGREIVGKSGRQRVVKVRKRRERMILPDPAEAGARP